MTSAPAVIDQELAQFGWIESVATNSISDFKSRKSNAFEQTTDKNNSNFIDKFICHLIFYIIFCYSFFIFIVIDLGLGSFIKNKMFSLMKLANESMSHLSLALFPTNSD
tara:strand:+ start:54 stop:380 length:327 start_codon:yes stop_codon:yes gene_type:complete